MNKNISTFKTSELLSLAPANNKRAYFYDAKTDGLELCVTSSGVKTFSARKWVNGGSKRLVLGHFNPDSMQSFEFENNPLSVLGNNAGLTLEQARRLCRAVIGEWASGRDPIMLKQDTRDQLKLGELFDSYINDYAKHHTKTWTDMIERFNRYLKHWNKHSVKTITRSEVQSLVNKLGRENGHTTANRTLELLRAVINKGIEWNLLKIENPATKITKFKLKARKRFLQKDEIVRLNQVLDEEEDEALTDYIRISLSTGARKSNVLSMQWEQVDLTNGIWCIPDTKNDESHTILLTEAELKILQRRFDNRTDFEWVFPGRGATGHLVDLKASWQRILGKAHIEELRLHDLRRTLGSYMAMSGASLSVIGNALNHKDVSTTRKVYAQTAHEAERLAREAAHNQMFDEKNAKDNKVTEIGEPKSKKKQRVSFTCTS